VAKRELKYMLKRWQVSTLIYCIRPTKWKLTKKKEPQITRAPLLPGNPHNALYQLKYWPTVVRITQTDHVSAWGAVSATATLYFATCIVLYTHRCTRHNYHTVSMQCRVCYQQTSAQPNLLVSTGP